MPVKGRRNLTFDFGQEGLYTPLGSYVVPTGGNPGAYLTGSPWEAIAVINFDPTVSVTYLSMSGSGWGEARAFLYRPWGAFVDFSLAWLGGTYEWQSGSLVVGGDSFTSTLKFYAGSQFQHGNLDNCVVEYEYEPAALSEPANPGSSSCELSAWGGQ